MLVNCLAISLIIVTVTASVHFVHRYAYKQGKEAGINEGRMQILQENLIRENKSSDSFSKQLVELVSGIQSNSKYEDLRAEIKNKTKAEMVLH